MDDDFDFDGDNVENLADYTCYEEYLDEQLNENDLFYLEDQELARQLVEVGYHGKGEILTRDQFADRKAAFVERQKNRRDLQVKALSHEACPIEDNPFLKALASREDALRNGR